ncbi:uncharacterized protein LOC131435273 [Malaya genurostris]|uniref:uncharacterized protein LOC131435273 n=1 Tax=Malaya genurostris TaxID=325434 RepID=UPI0026F3D35F|nr:uncharacterized protein LOC131435273 [Malaya genurostris]
MDFNDDYDIYGDLDGLEAETKKENKIIQELHTQIEELKAKIAEKDKEKQEIANKNAVLLENISSLLLTAKAELKRKDVLIADIRREKDNTVFRRKGSVHVRKFDCGTQTTLIQLLDQGIQTEREAMRSELITKKNDYRERSRSLEMIRGSREMLCKSNRDRMRAKSRERMKFNLDRRVALHEERKKIHKPRDRSRERRRERERRARRENRSPKTEIKHSSVRFKSPVRVKSEICASGDISSTFIPMNKKELDRYVKEIDRNKSVSPIAFFRESNPSEKDASKSFQEEHKKHSNIDRTKSRALKPRTYKRIEMSPKLKKQFDIIQSDEIGTTAPTANSTMFTSEDLEQKMTMLHGESMPKTPAKYEFAQTSTELLQDLNNEDSTSHLCALPPPTLVIPPPEPPIIEQVPEIPIDDDPKLNDSRELKIIESDELLTMDQEHEDEKNSTAETVIQNLIPLIAELEEGELPSSDDEGCGLVERSAKTVTNDTNADQPHVLTNNVKVRLAHVSKIIDMSKTVGRYDLTPRKDPIKLPALLQPELEQENGTKHKRNLLSAVKESDPSPMELFTSIKRQSELSHSKNRKKSHYHKSSKSLKKLFGTDEENSVCGSPIIERKRKFKPERKESTCDTKKRKKSDANEINDREIVVLERLSNKSILNEFKTAIEPEIIETSNNESLSKNTSDTNESLVALAQSSTDDHETAVQSMETSKSIIERVSVTIVQETSVEILQDDNQEQKLSLATVCLKTATNEKTRTDLNESIIAIAKSSTEEQETAVQCMERESIIERVPIANVKEASANVLQDETQEQPKLPSLNTACKGIATNEEKITDLEKSMANTNYPLDKHTNPKCIDSNLKEQHQRPLQENSFICSSRYSEYRIEFDNEVETTVYLTRKRKKKKYSLTGMRIANGTN